MRGLILRISDFEDFARQKTGMIEFFEQHLENRQRTKTSHTFCNLERERCFLVGTSQVHGGSMYRFKTAKADLHATICQFTPATVSECKYYRYFETRY